MKRALFLSHFQNFQFFSTEMVYRLFPNFDKRRLSERKKQWKLISIMRWWRCFTDHERSIQRLFHLSNHLHAPSYISCQSALAWYGLIPESVFATTAITTKKTIIHTTDCGNFFYQSIRPKIFTWYTIISHKSYSFSIALPGKAICDFLYYQETYDDTDAFTEWRINIDRLQEICTSEDISIYLPLYPKTTQRRISAFISFLQSHA